MFHNLRKFFSGIINVRCTAKILFMIKVIDEESERIERVLFKDAHSEMFSLQMMRLSDLNIQYIKNTSYMIMIIKKLSSFFLTCRAIVTVNIFTRGKSDCDFPYEDLNRFSVSRSLCEKMKKYISVLHQPSDHSVRSRIVSSVETKRRKKFEILFCICFVFLLSV